MQEKDNSNNNDKLKYHDFYHNLTQKGTNVVSRKFCKYREIQMVGKYDHIPCYKGKAHLHLFAIFSYFRSFYSFTRRHKRCKMAVDPM